MFVSACLGSRPIADVRAVLDLKAEGWTDRETWELTGVPINTIRAWRNRGLSAAAKQRLGMVEMCPLCGDEPHDVRSLPRDSYSYLLGVYLGDGCLARNGTSWTLRVALDDGYPGIVSECCDAIAAVRGEQRRPPLPTVEANDGSSSLRRGGRWVCLFPQHGPGPKHHRKIELAPWQREIVDAAPQFFLRGLIHTDGWRGLNRVSVKGRLYSYPRYQFSNRSDDVRKLFTDACDQLGVEWRQWTRFHVSVGGCCKTHAAQLRLSIHDNEVGLFGSESSVVTRLFGVPRRTMAI
jgi:hypothetical protein